MRCIQSIHPHTRKRLLIWSTQVEEMRQPRTESNEMNLDFLIYFQSADDVEANELAMPCRCFRQSHSFLLSPSEIFDHATQNAEQVKRRITNIFSTQRRSQCNQNSAQSVDLIQCSHFVILISFLRRIQCDAFETNADSHPKKCHLFVD